MTAEQLRFSSSEFDSAMIDMETSREEATCAGFGWDIEADANDDAVESIGRDNPTSAATRIGIITSSQVDARSITCFFLKRGKLSLPT